MKPSEFEKERDRPNRLVVALAATLMSGCSVPSATPTSTPDTASEYKLVVLVVVDQWPSWSFERDVRHLDHGLRRLVETGTVYPKLSYPHAATYTAAGHATLGSGATPSSTGIIGNKWYRQGSDIEIRSTSDLDSPEFNAKTGETVMGTGESSHALRILGIADTLRQTHGSRSRSIAISYKPRAAIYMLGRKPNLAVWYSVDQAAFTTSRYYTKQFPRWLRDYAHKSPISADFDKVWRPHNRTHLRHAVTVPDNRDGEKGDYGFDSAFPHPLSASGGLPAKAFRATAFAPSRLVDVAAAALDGMRLGDDEIPDLLALSFSSHDYAGHYWGQESWERHEILFAIDRALGRLMDHLDAKVGRDAYAIVLTSDHGASRMGKGGHKVLNSSLVNAARRTAQRILGPGNWIRGKSAEMLYLTEAAKQHSKRAQLIRALVATLENTDGVQSAIPTANMRCPADAELLRRICVTLDTERSGDVYIVPDVASTISDKARGASHGSPSPDDSLVPAIVFAPKHFARPHPSPTALTIAPTLATLLGIPHPAACTENALITLEQVLPHATVIRE